MQDEDERPMPIAFQVMRAILFRHKLWLAIGASVGGVLGLAAAHILPRTYVVESIVTASERQGISFDLGGVTGQLARMSGIGGLGRNDIAPALALLQSRGLCLKFAADVGLLASLFPETNTIQSSSWFWNTNAPTVDDACQLFHADILEVDSDELTGVVTLRAEWKDSAVAARWINTLVDMTNADLQASAIVNAEGALSALRVQLETEQPLEIERVIFNLIEQQLARVAVAKGAPQYALTVIDRAGKKLPEDYDFPSRRICALVGVIVGFSVVGLFVIFRASRSVRHA